MRGRLVLLVVLAACGESHAAQVIGPGVHGPHIASLSASSGAIGTSITLTGTGFSATQGGGLVTFGNVAGVQGIVATATSWSATSVTVTVPPNAITGTVFLFQNGVQSNGLTFTITTAVALSCADVTTRCVPSEYATIALASAATSAGDIVWVSAGTYSVTVSPAVSGTAGNTVTYLANGTVTICGMSFSGKSYIRVIGFTMNPQAGSCGGSPSPIVNFSGTNTALEFWNDDIGHLNNNGVICDKAAGAECDQFIWMGTAIHDIGNPSAVQGLTIDGNDSYFGYLNFSAICYLGLVHSGNRVRVVNPYFQPLVACGGHPDFYYFHNSSLGYSTSLIESMFGMGTPADTDNKIYNAELCHFVSCGGSGTVSPDWNDDVLRFSVTYNMGSASAYSLGTDAGAGAIHRWRQYHNTHYLGDRATPGSSFQTCGGAGAGGGVITWYVLNNIFQECWGAGNTANIGPTQANTAATSADYNLAYDSTGTLTFLPSWTSQTHRQSNVDPKFTNTSTPDLTLQSASGARGVGGPLTTASGSGSSSTSLTVAANTGSFFLGDNSANLPQYGGLLVPGDTITVGSCTAVVSSVSGDTLTLATACAWANGDPVYFGSSSTIDIGAYPYKAGGYTLSGTYRQSGSTVTVTPNDASITRFAVCYENLIPKAIADASTAWACPVGSGVITVWLYPRYATQTLSVQATAN